MSRRKANKSQKEMQRRRSRGYMSWRLRDTAIGKSREKSKKSPRGELGKKLSKDTGKM